jgi:hypothetical protein
MLCKRDDSDKNYQNLLNECVPQTAREFASELVTVCDVSGEFDIYFDASKWMCNGLAFTKKDLFITGDKKRGIIQRAWFITIYNQIPGYIRRNLNPSGCMKCYEKH